MSLLLRTRVSRDDRVWGRDSILMTRDQVETRVIRKTMMMMIAFITIKSSLVPLIEGLCALFYQ